MNLIKIAQSWYDFIQASPETKQLMNLRLSICDGCQHKTEMSDLGKVLITAVNSAASTYSCGACGCPLSPKTANPANSCPLNKWAAFNK
mgnify:FL=1